jgi:hypothetical protein
LVTILLRGPPRTVHHGAVDTDQVTALRILLGPSGWLEQTRSFAHALRGRQPRAAGGLLLVGTPDEEPWHLAAHLDQESRLAGIPGLAPTLVRWSPPPGAPAHRAQPPAGLPQRVVARAGHRQRAQGGGQLLPHLSVP